MEKDKEEGRGEETVRKERNRERVKERAKPNE
jgi:hypothetical protein